MRRTPIRRTRYGTAEWFGKPFHIMSRDEWARLAQVELSKQSRKEICPFRSSREHAVTCNKPGGGGICSVRQYTEELTEAGSVVTVAEPNRIITTCPYRLRQNALMYVWVAEVMLQTADPHIVPEVGFLESVRTEGQTDDAPLQRRKVGRIDNILVHADIDNLRWCALEVQTVYSSGKGMRADYEMILGGAYGNIPFPTKDRHPDFRSSGPKRLMPQLQTKIPTLRRWGKKMAVVVDEAFFGHLARMRRVEDISNCDIVWFVVKYNQGDVEPVITRGTLAYTTLEDAVEGLTAGQAVSLESFEASIRDKLPAAPAPVANLDFDR